MALAVDSGWEGNRRFGVALVFIPLHLINLDWQLMRAQDSGSRAWRVDWRGSLNARSTDWWRLPRVSSGGRVRSQPTLWVQLSSLAAYSCHRHALLPAQSAINRIVSPWDFLPARRRAGAVRYFCISYSIVSVCPSVCLFVCHKRTSRYCIETAKREIDLVLK